MTTMRSLLRNEVGQYPQKRGLAGPRSATDEQRLSAANLLRQEVRKWPRQRAASDQVIDRVMAAGELPYGECRGRAHDRRNHRRQAASVRELRVQQGVVLVELLAELIGDHFEAGAELAGVEGNGRFLAHDPVALVPPRGIGIAHDFADASSSSSGSIGRRNGRINSKLIAGTSQRWKPSG